MIWSDQLFSMLSIDRKNFDGSYSSFYERVHPEDKPKLEQVLETLNSRETTLEYRLRVEGSNGKITYLSNIANSELDDDGQLVRLNGISQDITEQVKANRDLRRNEKLFKSLFSESPVAMAMVNNRRSVVKVNDSFTELFGYRREDILGEDLLEKLLPAEHHDNISQIYNNVYSGTTNYFEDQRVTKQGEMIDVFVGAIPVSLVDEIIAVFGIYIDISRLKTIENKLKESLKEKEILLAEIHHRVKNNLAIISGLLELESMNWPDESAVSKVMKQSKLRIQSMAEIHEKLYKSEDFSQLNLENYVSELVAAIFTTMQGTEKRVDYHIESDEIQLNINQAIPSALIINELVTNSFKYSFDNTENGKLDVMLRNDDGTVTIVVSDNGPGLPCKAEEMAQKSLGHKLVTQLIKQLEGELEVDTGPDIGTTYTITFDKLNKQGSSSRFFV